MIIGLIRYLEQFISQLKTNRFLAEALRGKIIKTPNHNSSLPLGSASMKARLLCDSIILPSFS